MDISKVQKAESGSWTLAGWAGVDSGRLMLADPDYPGQMSAEFLGSDCMPDGVASWAPHGQDIAITVLTPGDGLFPVSIQHDETGMITAMRVDFTYEARRAAHRVQEAGHGH